MANDAEVSDSAPESDSQPEPPLPTPEVTIIDPLGETAPRTTDRGADGMQLAYGRADRWKSPLPPAYEWNAYDAQSRDRMLAMAEAEQRHQHRMGERRMDYIERR